MINEKNNLPEPPKGWAWTTLGEIIDIRNGFAFKSADYRDNGVLLIRQCNLGYNKVDLEKAVYLPDSYLNRYAEFVVRKGEILVGMSGSIGKLCSYNLDTPALQNQRTGLIQFFEPKTKQYIRYYFQTLESPLTIMAKGVAVQNISATQIESCSIPLPPLPEQHRIVAKIEELFTKLDAGIEALKKVKAQLKRYRQAVLKCAFEGKLTEEWREENKDKIEPASILLVRIKQERRTKSKGKPKELPPVDTSDLPELPEGWEWARLGMCSDLITKGESPKWQGFDYADEGIPFIRSENVLWGYVDLSKIVNVPEEFHKKLKRSQLRPHDVLINLVGASIGRCGIVPSTVTGANINQAVAVVRPNSALDPSYLMHLLLSPEIQVNIHAGKVETARPNISLTDLNYLVIPLPPLPEQHRIVERIEHCSSVADKMGKAVEISLKQSERLGQSILKRAFEGRLTPQDPSDEPADKLLERIRIEKKQSEKDKRESGHFRKKGKSR